MPQKTTRLKFETERLKTGPLTHEISEAPEVFDLVDDPEYRFEEPVVGTLTLRMVGNSVLVTGVVRTTAQSPCARCLDGLRVPLRASVALTYMEDPRLLEPDKFPELVDDDTYWYDGEAIYPAEQLRELLLLELPTVAACELDSNDVCPINGQKFGPMIYGDAEPAKPVLEETEDDKSFASQLKKMRKDLKQ